MGTVFDTQLALGEAEVALMREAAYAFLSAGGTLSWKSWAALGPLSRDAFSAAGMRLRIETALAIIEAMNGD